MPTHAGPNIFGEETLVFGYDLADTVNSYVGEPTTNLAVPTWSNWGVDASGYSTAGTRTILSPYHVRIDDISSNTRQSFAFYSGFNASTTYTFSVKFKKIAGTPTLRFQIYSYVSGNWTNQTFPTTSQIGLTNKEGWQTASYSYTTAAGATGLYWYIQDGDDYTAYTHSFELKEIQLEAKSHATPFTAGTRSATQGLLPLIGNSTIDLTNVSFDSNAQAVFDGTDDSMVVGNNSALKNNNTSIEFVIKYLDTPNGDIIQFGVGSGAYAQYYYRAYSGNSYWNWYPVGTGYGDITIPNAALPLNQYHHIVMTGNDQGYVQFYINGVVQTGATRTRNTQPSNWTPADLTIGGFSWDGYSSSIIPSVKIYNRVLTASEISRNFNAIKSRFNI